MGATASITIEVESGGAIQAFRQINTEAAKIGPGLAPAVPAMERVETSTKKAREAAHLLGDELGVHMPRALRGVLAESTMIGPALSAAFSSVAVIGFVEVAKHAGETLAEFVANLAGWGEEAKKQMDAQVELNKVFVETQDKIDKLDKAYRLIGLQGVEAFREKQSIANEELDQANAKVTRLTEELQKLQKQARETQTVPIIDIGTGLQAGETTESTADAQKAAGKIQEATNKLAEAQAAARELGVEVRNAGKETSDAIKKMMEEGSHEIALMAQEALTKLRALTAEADKTGASPEQQINTELRTRQELLAQILTLDGDDARVRAQVAIASVAIEKSASQQRIKILTDEADKKLQQIDEDHQAEEKDDQQRLEKQRRMEDETLGIERSAAVATAAPWDRANASIVASYQERMEKIREMLNTGDLDEAHAARQRAASGAAAGLAPTLGGYLSQILGHPTALLGGAGLLISSLGMGGGLKGALSGAAGGALIGSIIPGIGTLLGAGIGALIGLIGGLFGEHKGDKARKQVMEPLMAQIKVIRDSYDVFQTDYNSGVSELEQLRSQAIANLKQIGGNQVGGNTRSTNKLVDDAETYLKTTEAERMRRAQLQFGPAQFETGGFVGAGLSRGIPFGFSPAMAFASGGAVPAIVHEGEYVMQRSAVDRIGRGNLDRMNEGGRGSEVHNHFHINAIDAKSFDEFLRAGGTGKIIRNLRLAQLEGAW